MIKAEKNPNGYNVLQVIDVIRELSHSQGFYSRIYRNILLMQENDPDSFEVFREMVESKNFKEPVDVVIFFEC